MFVAGTHDAKLPGFRRFRTAENRGGKVMLTSRCMAVTQLPREGRRDRLHRHVDRARPHGVDETSGTQHNLSRRIVIEHDADDDVGFSEFAQRAHDEGPTRGEIA